jgi:hypothetical protein
MPKAGKLPTCRGMPGERHGMCESNTAALLNQMGKTQSKTLAERHDRGTAWGRHGMCESPLLPLVTGSACCTALLLLRTWWAFV